MTTHTRLRLGALALVFLTAALLSGSHLCGVALNGKASDPGMRPIGSGALACTEFWLYRYQTLIGAVAALAAAAATWFGIRRQLGEASRQSAIAMLPILEERAKRASIVRSYAEKIPASSQSLSEAAVGVFEKGRVLGKNAVAGQGVEQATEEFGAALQEYKSKIAEFSQILTEFELAWDYGPFGPSLRAACCELHFPNNIALQRYSDVVPYFEKCVERAHGPVEDIVPYFAKLDMVDASKIHPIPGGYMSSMIKILQEVGIIETDRDNLFDKTRG